VQHTLVLSGDLDASGWAAVMAAKGLAAAQSMRRRIFRNREQMHAALPLLLPGTRRFGYGE